MGQLYRPGPIEPIVLPGEYILAQFLNNYQLYQAVFIEPLPPSPQTAIDLLANQSGGLGSLQSTNFVNSATQLDMFNGDLGQFRWFVLDDARVQIYQPGQVARYQTRNAQLSIDPFAHKLFPDDELTETYVFGNERPYFVVTNPTASTITMCRIIPYGFRLVLAGKEGTVTGTGKQLTPIEKFNAISDAIAYKKRFGIQFTVVPVGGFSGGVK